MRTSSPMLSVFLMSTLCAANRQGLQEKLLLDPGFGFGKNLSHNYQLLARLGEFHHFGLPLLVGMSRKSMVGQLLNVGPSERLNGSLRVPSLQQCRARRLSASMMSKKR